MIFSPELMAQPVPSEAQPGEELSWLRVFAESGMTNSVYQPQIEKWEGNMMVSRMAGGIQSARTKSPTFGVVWMTAKADIDTAARIVTMQEFKITNAKFPTQPPNEPEYLKFTSKNLLKGIRTVALDHLESSFAIKYDPSRLPAFPD